MQISYEVKSNIVNNLLNNIAISIADTYDTKNIEIEDTYIKAIYIRDTCFRNVYI